MTGIWRISELRRAVEIALRRTQYDGQVSGRVREVPDTRTIRYYTTMGLVDRASEMQGRTALYDRRHVLQLVAIKRLQAAGKPLVQVQAELLGATQGKLEKLADLPGDFWEQLDRDLAQSAPSRKPDPVIEKKAFWEKHPEFQTSSKQDEIAAAHVRHEVRFEFPSGIVITIPADLVRKLDQPAQLRMESDFAPLLSQLAEQLQMILSSKDVTRHRVDLKGN